MASEAADAVEEKQAAEVGATAEVEADEVAPKPSGHAAKEAGALAMLDSIVKEREMDTAMVQDAMNSLMQDHEAEKKARLARERALRSVEVSKADISVSG